MGYELTKVMGFKELEQWGDFALKAKVVPMEKQKDGTFKPITKEQAMAVIQSGSEMGVQPLQSLRLMSFVRGRLCMAVQLQLALAKNRGVTIEKVVEGPGTCTVTMKRGEEERTCTWTRKMALKAKLVYTGGSWDKYEVQMLRWRCIGDCLKLIAPDFVMGLLSPEEAETIETPLVQDEKVPGKPDVKMPEELPLPTEEPKKDKPAPSISGKCITERQVSVLTEACGKKGITVKGIAHEFKVKTIEALPQNKMLKAMEFIAEIENK